MRPVRTLTSTTQAATIKFTWARSESLKRLHETGTRLQIDMNVYMKHTVSIFLLWSVSIISALVFNVKCSTANKNAAKGEKKSEFIFRLFSAQTSLVWEKGRSKTRGDGGLLSIFDASSASIKSSTIASLKNPAGLIFFGLFSSC